MFFMMNPLISLLKDLLKEKTLLILISKRLYIINVQIDLKSNRNKLNYLKD